MSSSKLPYDLIKYSILITAFLPHVQIAIPNPCHRSSPLQPNPKSTHSSASKIYFSSLAPLAFAFTTPIATGGVGMSGGVKGFGVRSVPGGREFG